MVNEKSSFSLYTENDVFELAMFSSVGGREEQQDCSGYELDSTGGLVVVCDGMGGHAGGKLASNYAVSRMLELFKARDMTSPLSEVLLNSAESIDAHISSMTSDDGTRMNAGSTIVCAAIDKTDLYWLSVGDSRIYLSRSSEFVQITTDHNYQTRLDMELANGIISQEHYNNELPKADALISFLGIGGLSVIDSNDVPFCLQKDDKIILATDGLYKIISDEQIRSLTDNFTNISDALRALELKVRRIASQKNIGRDNMTAAIIKIRQELK